MDNLLQKIVGFLQEIGIEVNYKTINETTLLPGIKIDKGIILIDRNLLKYPGDLLHEAGHIAVVPKAERYTLNEFSIAKREQREAEEMMTIAWSYAASVHLNIDANIVFHDNGYKGGGGNIAEDFRKGRYFGVPMLQWHKMTVEKKNEIESNINPYPAMLKWTLD